MAIKRGDLTGMSFGFKVPEGGSHYDPKTNTRTITKIEKVYEVSIVPFPAYPQTSVEARSQIEGVKKELESPERVQAKSKVNQILKRSVLYKFNSLAEAFNYYRNHDIKELRKGPQK